MMRVCTFSHAGCWRTSVKTPLRHRPHAFSVGNNGLHDEDVPVDILQKLKDDSIPERFVSLDALLLEVRAIKEIG